MNQTDYFLTLIKRWAQAPWHAWIKEDQHCKKLFAELWTQLPFSVTKKMLLSNLAFVVLPPPSIARVIKIKQPLYFGAHILQLDEKLFLRPLQQQIAILAHEIAHFCINASTDADQNDLAADALVCAWGLAPTLSQALAEDLPVEHPRNLQVQAHLNKLL